jgi:hypothetical protein
MSGNEVIRGYKWAQKPIHRVVAYACALRMLLCRVGSSGRHHRSPAALPVLVDFPPRWKACCNNDSDDAPEGVGHTYG